MMISLSAQDSLNDTLYVIGSRNHGATREYLAGNDALLLHRVKINSCLSTVNADGRPDLRLDGFRALGAWQGFRRDFGASLLDGSALRLGQSLLKAGAHPFAAHAAASHAAELMTSDQLVS
jgi:hypothetical protein